MRMRYIELRKAIFREPFKPVRLTADSGESVVVRHVENIIVTPYFVLVASERTYFTSEPEKITSVTTLRSANGNGSRS